MRELRSAALLLLIWALPVSAQDKGALAHIRDLYSNAAYEDVLSALAVDGAPPPPELGQYKVFSLIALGRDADAEKAAEAVLIANPRFQAGPDASPRVLELFTKVRRRVAPELMKSMYLNAKAALDRKDRDVAIRSFSEIVEIAGDPELKGDTLVGELQLLASGFLELSRALPDPTAPTVNKSAAPPPAAALAPVAPLPAAVQDVTPPAPLHEVMPPWTPPVALAGMEFRGRIFLRIDADGNVVASEMLVPTTALYDTSLLKASKQWHYKPATSNGNPIPSERIVEIVLKPRQTP
jgi:hypothetical protein